MDIDPIQFEGDWADAEHAAIRAIIMRHDGAAVDATYNNWVFWRNEGPDIRPYTWRRATWGRLSGADTLDDLLAQLRTYYHE